MTEPHNSNISGTIGLDADSIWLDNQDTRQAISSGKEARCPTPFPDPLPGASVPL